MFDTEIVHGSENVVECLVQLMQKVKLSIDVCVDRTRPILAIEIRRLKDTITNWLSRYNLSIWI